MDLRIHAIHVGEWDGELQPTAGKNYLVCLGNIYSIHQKSHLLLLGWPPCTSFFLFDIPWFKDSNLFLHKIKNELVGVILKGEFKLSIKKWHHSSVHAKWVFSKLKNKNPLHHELSETPMVQETAELMTELEHKN